MIPSLSVARRIVLQVPDPGPALERLRSIAAFNHTFSLDCGSWEDADHWRRVVEELTEMIEAVEAREENRQCFSEK